METGAYARAGRMPTPFQVVMRRTEGGHAPERTLWALRSLLMIALVAALLGLAAAPFPRTAVRADTDTVSVSRTVDAAATEAAVDVERLRVRPIVSPSALYSGSKGFGVGGGFAADRVLRPGDHLQVEARLAQHLQGGFAEYLTGDSRRSPLVGLLGVGGWTTSRTRFEGHGPHSASGTSLFLDRLAAEAEARLKWSPAGPGGLLLQPTLRGRFDRLRGVTEPSTGALAAADPADTARLDALVGTDRYGVDLALSAVRDTRDAPSMPTHGAYLDGEVGRFQALDGSGLGFVHAQALATLFRPAPFQLPLLAERGSVFLRLNAAVTRQDGADPLPWFYLPELDRDLVVGYPRRGFAGRDALSIGVGGRSVIGPAIGPFRAEGVALVMVGAAYDDVFREFTPRVRFSSDRTAAGSAVPLQPSLALGLNLHTARRERPLIGALVGIGPGGVTLTSLRLVYGLGDFRPRFR